MRRWWLLAASVLGIAAASSCAVRPASLGANGAPADSTPTSSASATDSTIAPPGMPYFVTITTAAGVPPDSSAFWTAFRSTFLDQGFVTEKPGGRQGRFTVSVPLRNRFVLMEGTGGPWDDESYRVQLEIVPLAPAPRDTAPRASIATFTIPAGVDPRVVRVPVVVDTIRFERARAGGVPSPAVIARNAALLVLERVHRLAGELPEGERLVLDRARRISDRSH